MFLTPSVLHTVIQLAQERARLYDDYTSKEENQESPMFAGIPFLGEYENAPEEYRNYENSKSALETYLSTLNHEVIKDLLTLMYLGRNNSWKDEKTGMDRFVKHRQYFDERGWHDDLWVEVNQMVSKLPLDEYLINGKNIIGW